MISAISEYRSIKEGLSELIDSSGYRQEYLAKKVGIKPGNFSIKKLRNSWSEAEVEKIINLLTKPNEEVIDALLLKIAKARKSEEPISYEEYKKEVSKWK
jgi:hypothetical protein